MIVDWGTIFNILFFMAFFFSFSIVFITVCYFISKYIEWLTDFFD